MLCQVVKNGTIISCRHGGFLLAKMEHLFVRVFGGSPQFWITGGDVLNERQRSRNAVGFNKIASRFAWGQFVQRWRGQKSKKAVDVCWEEVSMEAAPPLSTQLGFFKGKQKSWIFDPANAK